MLKTFSQEELQGKERLLTTLHQEHLKLKERHPALFAPTSWSHFERLAHQNELFLRKFFVKGGDFSVGDEGKGCSVEEIKQWVYPESRGAFFCLLNGRFVKELSCQEAAQKLIALPFSQAFKTYGALLSNQQQETLQEEKGPFAALNSALYQDGLFLYLPPKIAIEGPVQILHLITGDNTPFITSRLHLFAGNGSSVRVQQRVVGLDCAASCLNHVTEVMLESKASLHFTETTLDLPPKHWQFSHIRARLKEESSLHVVALGRTGEMVRRDVRIRLVERGASADYAALNQLKGKEECHTTVSMEHIAPDCRSRQQIKSILAGSSRSSFEGRIYVSKVAEKTDAFQMSNALLLHPGALTSCKPNLEIFNADVKASHGATIGELDPEALFYLRARGLDEGAAKEVLLRAFAQEIVDKVPLISVKEAFLKGSVWA